MGREKEPPMLIDLSDRQAKIGLMQHIGTLQGLHEISIKPRKFNRSTTQNAYWWAAIVKPFCEHLRREWGDPTITMEQAHIELKLAVLGPKEIKNSKGDSKLLIPTSHDLDTMEFGMLIDKAAEWLNEWCGIVVIPSDVYTGKAIG